MKYVITITTFLIMGLSSAFAKTSEIELAKEHLRKLNGTVGTLTSDVEPNLNGKPCTIDIEEGVIESFNKEYLSLRFKNTGLYFTPVAHIDAESTLVEDNTILVSTSSERPGGDACGSFGGAMRYKKTITIEEKAITISESFRCAGELFKKYELNSTCSFK
ncbi:MAG: hypothetical protein ACLGGX_09170 [Bdellovibrionia bacterium]